MAMKQNRPLLPAGARVLIKNLKWEAKFRVRIVRLKRQMKEISKEQEVIGLQQREIRGKIAEIREKCTRIRQESHQIFKQQASNQILLDLMFTILRARNNDDFLQAHNATTELRELTTKLKSGEDTTDISN